AVGGALAALAGAKQRLRAMWSAFGAAYILAPCVALVWLRTTAPNGLALTLMLFLIVWMADIGAYFGGRFIGGPRISRALSPEKTWAGVFAGVAMGGVAGAASKYWVVGDGALVSFIIIGAGLGLSSIVGDLAESALKRRFGVKDSSGFIPGHGGFLDRLDGMIFATVAMTTALFAHMVMK
ncbi:MAG: phosphatidate cytidylyltransferase, partial [Pseudomonadota bacterium]